MNQLTCVFASVEDNVAIIIFEGPLLWPSVVGCVGVRRIFFVTIRWVVATREFPQFNPFNFPMPLRQPGFFGMLTGRCNCAGAIHAVVEPMQHLSSDLVAFTCSQVAIVIQSGNMEYPVCKREAMGRFCDEQVLSRVFVYMEPRIDTRQIGHWAAS